MRLAVRDHLSSWMPPSGSLPLISKKKGDTPRLKTPKSCSATYEKRQRKKSLTHLILSELLPFQSSRMQAQYQRAWTCGDRVEQCEGKLRTHYCKTKVCLVCNGIRTAMLIDAYTPILASWSDPVLVTLTVPNVHLDKLRSTVDGMTDQFKLTAKQLRRAGMDVQAVRVIEVTGKRVDSVHPHFHCVFSSGAVGRAFVQRWLDRYPNAVRAAQDVRTANTDSLKELFKYVTKLTEDRPPPHVLDGILSAMWGKHLVRPFGFRLERDPMEDEAFDELVPVNDEFKRYGEHVVWMWEEGLGNWVDHTTGEMLVDTSPAFVTSGFA